MKKGSKSSNGGKPRQQDTPGRRVLRYQDGPGVVNVIFQLKGEDAKRLLDYEEREKLRTHGQAVYKLMFERLDQLEAAAGSLAEKV